MSPPTTKIEKCFNSQCTAIAQFYCSVCDAAMCAECRDKHHTANVLTARHEGAGMSPHPSLAAIQHCQVHRSSDSHGGLVECAECRKSFRVGPPDSELPRLLEKLQESERQAACLASQRAHLLMRLATQFPPAPIEGVTVSATSRRRMEPSPDVTWTGAYGTTIQMSGNNIESTFNDITRATFIMTFAAPMDGLDMIKMQLHPDIGVCYKSFHLKRLLLEFWLKGNEQTAAESVCCPWTRVEVPVEWVSKKKNHQDQPILQAKIQGVFPENGIMKIQMTCIESEYVGSKPERKGRMHMGFNLPLKFYQRT